MSLETVGLWAAFTALICILLAVDLLLVNGKAQVMTVSKALLWSAMWISAALVFNVGVFVFLGDQKGFEFLTGYLIEKSLSVDNLFVFLIIFGVFAVPPTVQPRALTWGIIGALVMRFVFIVAGAALLEAFHWIVFVFGGLLLFTAFRLAIQKEHGVDPEKNPLIRALRFFFPVLPDFHGSRFFVRLDGRLAATPFMAVMLVIASTDLVFAVDSIPAIFAITNDPFIVYTSNAFAILGMRALFFALAGVMQYFTFIRHGIIAILIFVGIKMIISEWYKVPVPISLAFIGCVLLIAVALSLVFRKEVSSAHSTEPATTPAGPH